MDIAVIGCGYIGSETALLWKKMGHHITATTRNPERLTEIMHFAQESFLIQGTDEAQFRPLIEANEAFLVSVGADKPEEYDSAYTQIAQMIRNIAGISKTPKRLIYTSSTSVYGDHRGEWVDEKSALKTDTDQAKILLKTERLYESLKDLGWQVCILRLAEIYGPKREVSKRLKNHTSPFPGTGEQYTNMIHKYDCRDAIDFVLEKELTGIFNLADDDHPTRKELYEMVALQMHLPKPHWDPSHPSLHKGNKRVSNHKIKSEGFAFKFPHRVLS